jgi:argininosuccinate lyase
MDAVASRGGVLRILSAAAILGLTLSRLAADLLLWTRRSSASCSCRRAGEVQLDDAAAQPLPARGT